MPIPEHPPQVRPSRWRGWLGLFLVIPLSALSAALLFGLYRHILTGQLSTVAKGYGATSRTILFSESPILFTVFLVFHAAFAVVIILVTVVVARLSVKGLRSR
jgi:hypothetical protein